MNAEPAYVLPARLFVYGTLQPGRLRWPLLEPFVTSHRPASVPGRMFDSGNGWPVAVFEPSADVVPGVLIDLRLDRLAEALRVLDAAETAATDLLARVVVTTTEDDAAWAYHCGGPTSSMVRIGRWHGIAER